MDLKSLQDKLLAAARANPPADAVPYAFEQRMLARLRSTRVGDAVAGWSSALWQGALACVAVTVLSGAWTLYSAKAQTQANFDFEQVVVAMAEAQLDETW